MMLAGRQLTGQINKWLKREVEQLHKNKGTKPRTFK
jgi:hypothetical protein